jgi:hypothetical protein
MPKEVDPFPCGKELGSYQIGTLHRNTSRRWTAWLRSDYPQAEFWTGWSEVQFPCAAVIPNALAWGRIQGYETLLWLEVGNGHKKNENITQKRLNEGLTFCRKTGVHLVFAQVSPNWVKKAAFFGFKKLPQDMSVVLGSWKRRSQLPIIE